MSEEQFLTIIDELDTWSLACEFLYKQTKKNKYIERACILASAVKVMKAIMNEEVYGRCENRKSD